MLRSQKGQLIPLAAVAMGTVLMIAALAVDVGYIVSTRGQLEAAADSAALAAIEKANTDATTAEQIARDFASQHTASGQNVLLSSVQLGQFDFSNYFANGNADLAFFPGLTPITAAAVVAARNANVATGPLGLFFARIFGIQNVNVSRKAIAVQNPYVSGAPARTHVIPFVVHESLIKDANGNIKVGQLVNVRLDPVAPAPPLPAGGFGWLSTLWDQSHAPDVPGLRDAIQFGLPVDAKAPATVFGTPGVKGGSLNSAFLALMQPNSDETQGAYAGKGLKTQKNCNDKGLTTFTACTGATGPLSCTTPTMNCTQTCTQTCTSYPSCPPGYTCPPYCTNNCTQTCTPGGMTCTGGTDFFTVGGIANQAVVYIPIYDTSSDQGAGALFNIKYFIAARINSVILTGDLSNRRVEIRILGTETYPAYVTSDLFSDPNAPPNPTLKKLQLIG